MKKRILFVDDEPLVLQGLQRTLRSMRHEWEMDFAEGGARALDCVASTAYDVVVSDMVMPGMDGAQLLKAIQHQSPQTIRLVLSGHAEQQLSMKCVGVAHQYLSKPCDVDTLKDTLIRVTSLDFTIANRAVLELLSRLERLPNLPVVCSELARLLNDPNACMEDVGAVIARDMAITAQILKVVNSSFFGMPRHVSEPMEAAAYLGVDTVKALVLATSVFNQFEASTSKDLSIEGLSQHSQRAGAVARLIAHAEGATQTVVNESLVAGLLHDAGKLILVANLPEQFTECAALVAGSGFHPLDAERKVFGATHADVAGYVLGLWGLPPPVIEAIALHHTPHQSKTLTFSAVTAVHVANALIWERTPSAAGVPTSVVDTAYLTSLGLADRLPAWRSAADKSSPPSSTEP